VQGESEEVRGEIGVRQTGVRHLLHHEQEGCDELQEQEER